MHRWAQDSDFRKRVEELRVNLAAQAEEILKGGIVKAAETVVDLASGNLVFVDAKELNPRLRAALYILDKALKQSKLPPVRTGSRGPLPMLAGDDELHEAIEQAKSP